MDDTAHLRQTIRRCTAVLVLAIGITGWTLAQPRDPGAIVVMVVLASLYLFNPALEMLGVAPDDADTRRD